MTSLDDVPRPLRPLAVRVLAAISPFYVPPWLADRFRATFEAERRALTAATRGWGREHWERLSIALSTATHAVQIAGVVDLMRHLALDVPVEDTTFRVYHPQAGDVPSLSPPRLCLGVAPAALREAIAKTTREVGAELSRRQAGAALRRLLENEQTLGRQLASEVVASLEAGANRLASARREVVKAVATSSACKSEIERHERALKAADLKAAELGERGDRLSQQLMQLQEERRRELESGDPGHATSAGLASLDARSAAILEDLNALSTAAQDLEQRIERARAAVEAAGRRHREQAEAAFDGAYRDAQRLKAELRGMIAALAQTAEADRHWRRIEPLLGQYGADPQLMRAQLRALGLWQFGSAPGQAEKREASQRAQTLLQEVDRALAAWRRPMLTPAGG
jgi:hypothetical protein